MTVLTPEEARRIAVAEEARRIAVAEEARRMAVAAQGTARFRPAGDAARSMVDRAVGVVAGWT